MPQELPGSTPTPRPPQPPGHPGELLAVQTTQVRVGPLPDPDTLKQYEQVHPGLAKIIIEQFEKQAAHRQAMEMKVANSQIENQKDEYRLSHHGQLFGFLIATLGLILAGVCVRYASSAAQAWAGASIGGVSLATLVGAFVYGRKARPSEENGPDDGEE